MLNRTFFHINKLNKLVIYSSIAILFFLYLLKNYNVIFEYDAAVYWHLRSLFNPKNFLNFKGFDYPQRGYAYPFILFLIQRIAAFFTLDDKTVFFFFSSLLFAFIPVYLSDFIAKLYKLKITNIQSLVICSIIFYFWRAHFIFPLTDFISIVIFLLAIILLLNFISLKKYNDLDRLNFISFTISSMLMTLSFIIRPAYQIGLIIYIPLSILCLVLINKVRYKIITIFLFILGSLFISGPQLYINYYNHDIISPFVQTQLVYDGTDLFVKQIEWGLEYQKYDTYVGDDSNLASVFYRDNSGAILIKEFNGNITLSSLIEKIIQRPFDFVALYARHLFNGLDIIDNSPYIQSFNKDRSIFSLINYSLWYLFFVSMYYKFKLIRIKSIWDDKSIFSFLVIMLSILFISLIGIIGAVETRFLIPLFIFMYTEVILNIPNDFYKIKDLVLRNKMKIVLWLFFVFYSFSMSTLVMSQIQNFNIPLIH